VTDEVKRAMHARYTKPHRWPVALAALLLPLVAGSARGDILGVSIPNGGTVAVTAKETHIATGEGNTLLAWGYALNNGTAQYPGPTLILDQGSTVTVQLTNTLPVPVSIVFPGQVGVTATGGANTQDGLLTKEALAGGTVSYTLTATNAGTYVYQSGSRPELEIEMGLVGAIIVRPTGFNPSAPTAYGHPDTAYDKEYLFLLSEMDPNIHSAIELDGVGVLATHDYFANRAPNYWFLNGRTGPDTLLDANEPLFPSQPYNSAPTMNPGQKLLMRVVGAGQDGHTFHHHGNHARVIARDGRMLASGPATGPDLSYLVFTVPSVPGKTEDVIFEWTGKDLGWDIYGTPPDHVHTCSNPNCPDTTPADGFDDTNPAVPCWDVARREYCPDHGKPIPVSLPGVLSTELGPYYSGSPFMGVTGFRPPGNAPFNPSGGFGFMFHSHVERELTNFNIFPGGMMTMLIVEPLVPTP